MAGHTLYEYVYLHALTHKYCLLVGLSELCMCVSVCECVRVRVSETFVNNHDRIYPYVREYKKKRLRT